MTRTKPMILNSTGVEVKPKTRTGKQILKELEQFKRGFMRGYLAAKKANQSK